MKDDDVASAATLLVHHDAGSLNRLQGILALRFEADYDAVLRRS